MRQCWWALTQLAGVTNVRPECVAAQVCVNFSTLPQRYLRVCVLLHPRKGGWPPNVYGQPAELRIVHVDLGASPP